MITEKINVPICKDCYDKKHFTGRLYKTKKYKNCSYCKTLTVRETIGYKASL